MYVGSILTKLGTLSARPWAFLILLGNGADCEPWPPQRQNNRKVPALCPGE